MGNKMARETENKKETVDKPMTINEFINGIPDNEINNNDDLCETHIPLVSNHRYSKKKKLDVNKKMI